ncbi:hypothetical protein CALVIDRAFT_559449 [Calocera viscosa TUFC12733]|uniref:START domain-containing protein n=1 Tax=Calocera viscosa (strain TUFC12733) TaxID=1330018 RepID=A0A167S7K2_CALVF|nr:hypothetical protein CALVIDRAFT_559449 [Calocera viscosa TUFC12733]
MSEGSRIRESWLLALTDAQNRFRSLLSAPPTDWKRVPLTQTPTKHDGPVTHPNKGKNRPGTTLSDVAVHRRQNKEGEVYRAMLDVFTDDGGLLDSDNWKVILQTPELRKSWDPIVDGSHLVELLDPDTRISKTEFKLGWPANPRDAITIARIFSDSSALIDISTSLPRSSDDPAYLRPSPPYVRSNVRLSSWCIQFMPPTSPTDTSGKGSVPARVRLTCFWQHDLNAVWGMAGLGIGQHLPILLLSLVETVRQKGNRIPRFIGYGLGISIFSIVYGEAGREALVMEYAIIRPEDDEFEVGGPKEKTLEEVRLQKERRRLERTVEIGLPSMHGWDLQVTVKAPSEETAAAPWAAQAGRITQGGSGAESGRLVFRLVHPPPPTDSIVSVKLVAELAGGVPGIRVNGLPREITSFESRDPVSFAINKDVFGDVSDVQAISIHTINTADSTDSGPSTQISKRPIVQTATERSPAAEKSILSLVRRNYIYFTSLLQEPEAKWKPVTESRGVTVTQLDSIDPTLVVYRAAAVFVGVTLWDLFSMVDTPGTRVQWDRSFEDATLLEDVNELTDLWHWKTKGVWPVMPRDSILLKTAYKSSSSVHVFAFSTDDANLFPSIPPTDPNFIRSQVDLQGWAVEVLSPTTTQITLLDQSDPKGWSNKAYIPQQMIATLAGMGEFAIKLGSPPMIARLGGARVSRSRYEFDKGSFRLEYEGSEQRRSSTQPAEAERLKDTTPLPSSIGDEQPPSDAPPAALVINSQPLGTVPKIECEIRIDADTWASHVEILIDPPPQAVSCLRRHRLAPEGGGLWVTIEHDAIIVGEERILAQIRKVPGSIREKAVVTINGAKVKVDVNSLPEAEIKSRSRQKRVKPARMPLDQPPVPGLVRRRRMDSEDGDLTGIEASSPRTRYARMSMQPFASPVARWFTMAVEQASSTTSAAAAAASAAIGPTPASLLKHDPTATANPLRAVLGALSTIQRLQAIPVANWISVSDRDGFSVSRRIFDEISPTIPMYRAEKVIEGVSAEDVANLVIDLSCRKKWDDRLDSSMMLEEYGYGCSTAFVTLRTTFPFQNRGFYVASITGRAPSGQRRSQSDGNSTPASSSGWVSADAVSTIYHVTASFPESALASHLSAAKINPTKLSIGQIHLHGWVMETLDPYTTENYTIPSTRVIQFSAIDFAGSLPLAVNGMLNSVLPQSILAIQRVLRSESPVPSLRWPARALSVTRDEEVETGLDWTMDAPDDQRRLISQTFSATTKTFETRVVVKPRRPGPATRPSTPLDKDKTPTMPTAKLAEMASPSKTSIEDASPRSSPVPFPAPASLSVNGSASDGGTVRISRGHIRSSSFTARSLSLSSPLPRSRLASSAKPTSANIPKTLANSDFVIGELLIYPDLYESSYRIDVGYEPLPGSSTSKPLDLTVKSTDGVPSDLQIRAVAYTLPPSPLHSHGMDLAMATPPTKHLLRFTLPTAAYYAPVSDLLSIDDTADGNGQQLPAWLKELEDKGAVISFTITGNDAAAKREILLAGQPVKVFSEKESVDVFGTEELEDNRVGKLAKLRRGSASDGQTIPKELRQPIAVAMPFVDDDAVAAVAVVADPLTADPADTEASLADATSQDAAVVVDGVDAKPVGQASLLGFFSTNNLMRLTPSLTIPSFISSPLPTRPGTPSKGPKPPISRRTSRSGQIGTSWGNSLHHQQYSLRSVIIIALIAFLLGSLIRSLLSPADFMFYPSRSQNESLRGEDGGWREVKRLVEVRWILWGWDAVIFAVVRRH